MNMIKLSKNNNFVRLYKAMYPDSILPRSICPLFWKVLVGLLLTILSPAACIYGVVQKLRKQQFYWFDFGDRDGIGYMFFFDKLIIMAYIAIVGVTSGDSVEWHDFILGPLYVVVFIPLFVASVYAGIKLQESYKSNKNKTKKPSVIGEAIKAQWNKVCPIIEYED